MIEKLNFFPPKGLKNLDTVVEEQELETGPLLKNFKEAVLERELGRDVLIEQFLLKIDLPYIKGIFEREIKKYTPDHKNLENIFRNFYNISSIKNGILREDELGVYMQDLGYMFIDSKYLEGIGDIDLLFQVIWILMHELTHNTSSQNPFLDKKNNLSFTKTYITGLQVEKLYVDRLEKDDLIKIYKNIPEEILSANDNGLIRNEAVKFHMSLNEAITERFANKILGAYLDEKGEHLGFNKKHRDALSRHPFYPREKGMFDGFCSYLSEKSGFSTQEISEGFFASYFNNDLFLGEDFKKLINSFTENDEEYEFFMKYFSQDPSRPIEA